MDDRRRDPEAEALALIESIKRWLRWLVIATVVLYLVNIGAGIYIASVQAQIHDSLCTLRNDLDTRIAQTKQLLKHPEDASGISVEVLRQSVIGQMRTRAALEPLSCPPPVEVPPPISTG